MKKHNYRLVLYKWYIGKVKTCHSWDLQLESGLESGKWYTMRSSPNKQDIIDHCNKYNIEMPGTYAERIYS